MRAYSPSSSRAPVAAGRLTRTGRAFTLLELLVVILIVGLLAGLFLPAYDLAKVRAQRGVCSEQLRKLGLAWLQFADENNDHLVDNQPLFAAGVPNDDCWITGSARLDHDPIYGPAPYYTATNQALARNSKLYTYVNSADYFRCPSDTRSLAGQRVVRSYSLNCWMNGQTMGDPSGYVSMAADDRQNDERLQYRFFRKQNQLGKTSELMVFIEESEATLSDSMFSAVKDLLTMRDLADLPSTRHRFSCPVTFADGHVGLFRLSLPSKLRGIKAAEEASRLQEVDMERLSTLSTESR